MTIFLICICCAGLDYILRSHGIIQNWFTQSYLIIGMLSACVVSTKTYNSICDRLDEIKKQKLEMQKHNDNVQNLYRITFKLIDGLFQENKNILEEFIVQNSSTISMYNQYTNIDMVDAVKFINSYLDPFDLHIEILERTPNMVISINKTYFDVLKMHFEEND